MPTINFNPLHQAAPAEQTQSFPINELPGNVIKRIAFFMGSEKNSMGERVIKKLSTDREQLIDIFKCREFIPDIERIIEKLDDTASADQKASLCEILSELSMDIEGYKPRSNSIKIKIFEILKTLVVRDINAVRVVLASKDMQTLLFVVSSLLVVNNENAHLGRHAPEAIAGTVRELLGENEVHLAVCFADSIADELQKAMAFKDISDFLIEKGDLSRALEIVVKINGDEKAISIRDGALANIYSIVNANASPEEKSENLRRLCITYTSLHNMGAIRCAENIPLESERWKALWCLADKMAAEGNIPLAIDTALKISDQKVLNQALMNIAANLARKGSSDEEIMQVIEQVPNVSVRNEVLQDIGHFRQHCIKISRQGPLGLYSFHLKRTQTQTD